MDNCGSSKSNGELTVQIHKSKSKASRANLHTVKTCLTLAFSQPKQKLFKKILSLLKFLKHQRTPSGHPFSLDRSFGQGNYLLLDNAMVDSMSSRAGTAHYTAPTLSQNRT